MFLVICKSFEFCLRQVLGFVKIKANIKPVMAIFAGYFTLQYLVMGLSLGVFAKFSGWNPLCASSIVHFLYKFCLNYCTCFSIFMSHHNYSLCNIYYWKYFTIIRCICMQGLYISLTWSIEWMRVVTTFVDGFYGCYNLVIGWRGLAKTS